MIIEKCGFVTDSEALRFNSLFEMQIRSAVRQGTRIRRIRAVSILCLRCYVFVPATHPRHCLQFQFSV